MRKAIVHGAWLVVVAASVAGCGPATASSTSGSPTPSSSATAQPSGASTAAANPSTAPSSVPSGPQYPTGTSSASTSALSAAGGLLGLLPIPGSANAWTTNTNAPMGLDAFIKQVYDADSEAAEKSLYTQRGFVSGAYEGWFNADGSQQSVAIARFATASGATYAFGDLSGSFSQQPAPSTVFTDSADSAVGTTDPTLDSEGNAFVNITAHVGDYLVAVQEFSAKTPDPGAAKALLLEQVEGLKADS